MYHVIMKTRSIISMNDISSVSMYSTLILFAKLRPANYMDLCMQHFEKF